MGQEGSEETARDLNCPPWVPCLCFLRTRGSQASAGFCAHSLRLTDVPGKPWGPLKAMSATYEVSSTVAEELGREGKVRTQGGRRTHLRGNGTRGRLLRRQDHMTRIWLKPGHFTHSPLLGTPLSLHPDTASQSRRGPGGR